jgi:LacI family transcriptional regulator
MAKTDRPATLRDVATAAGVHPATASRALNPGTRLLVSEETAQRVTEVASRLGYRPNPVARSLRTRRSNTIGVLIPDLNNPLFPPIVRGIEDRLAEHGYVALIGNTDADLAKERLVFDQMRARHVDGFVLGTATAGSPILAEAAADDVPVVLMNRTSPDYPFSAVSADNEQGVRAAVAHLVALGHTRIGHIAGPQDASTATTRLAGFRAGMAAHDLPTPAPTRWRKAYAAAGSCSAVSLALALASPPSSPPTTCSPSAVTARLTSSGCAARRMSPWSDLTTCPSWTGCTRR